MQSNDFNKMYAKIRDLNDDAILATLDDPTKVSRATT